MTEEHFQKQVVQALEYGLPNDVWFTAVNPIPSKTPAVAGRSKAMGMKAGVPDLVLIVDGQFIGIELKTTKGRPSKSQVRCFNSIHDAGAIVHVCNSLEQVVDVLRGLGVGIKLA